MLQPIYIFLGFLAVATSGVSISNRLPADIKVAASAAAFILWTMWGFASYNIEVITDGGTVVTRQYIPLGILGILGGGVMLLYTIYTIMTMFGMQPERLLGVRL